MTKKEIIEAAFTVWGREFYLNTSLSHVASALGVCKPALYRHFINKNALLQAMTRHFFDDWTAFIREDYEKAVNNENKSESIYMLIRSVTEYYARNVDYFIFSMVQLREDKHSNEDFSQEIRARGIDFGAFHHSISKNYIIDPLIMRLIFTTLTFYMAGFHKTEKTLTKPPTEEAIAKIITVISIIIEKGMGFNNKEVDALDYERLENCIAGIADGIKNDSLLKAVAEAVAEAGPWGASMEQVARRSGLSKSSLYCHFKNKQDMLHQLFMTEALHIIDFARHGIRQSNVPSEQLYLGIISIAEYLRSNPDILVALDWIRTRKLNLPPRDIKEHGPMMKIMRLFDEIDIKTLKDSDSPFQSVPVADEGNRSIAPWILFLIVNTLMRKNRGQSIGKFINKDIRGLFRFITLGINGFKN